jgi:HNH endonuclease
MHNQRLQRHGDPLYEGRYGKGSIDKFGYRILWKNNRLIPEHRWLWEQANGPIPEGLILHHRDGNKVNNDLSNLELMSRGKHTRHHKRKWVDGCKRCSICKNFQPLENFYHAIRKSGKDKGKRAIGSWCKACHAKRIKKCVDCNKPINRHATRCRSCHGKYANTFK